MGGVGRGSAKSPLYTSVPVTMDPNHHPSPQSFSKPLDCFVKNHFLTGSSGVAKREGVCPSCAGCAGVNPGWACVCLTSLCSVKLWFWSSVVVEGAVGMDGSLGEFARPRGDQAPVPWPPISSKLSPIHTASSLPARPALEGSHMSQASCN